MAYRYAGGEVKMTSGQPVQTLPPDLTNHNKVTVGATSVSQSLGDGSVIRLASDTDCFINFGDSGVTATNSSMYFPAGVEIMAIPVNSTHIAVIQSSAGGFITITKMG